MFQRKGWMDTERNIEWAEKILVPGIPDKTSENVLFADNVNFQTEKRFHSICRKKANTVVYMLPANQTDRVQPIDRVREG